MQDYKATKNPYGYDYRGIRISHYRAGDEFTVRYDLDSHSSYYEFDRLVDAKAFIDKNYEPRWERLNRERIHGGR